MTNFLDGPAAGITLMLRRAPLFLRVTYDKTFASAVCKKGRTEWDALDMLDDTPAAHEFLYAYRREGNAGSVHIDGRDSKTGRRFGRTYTTAEYVLVQEQPDDETMRSAEKWQAWCTAMNANMRLT